MACGCKKSKPLGSSKTVTAAATAKRKKTSPPPTTGKTQSFTLQTRDGKTETFGSRLEAEAARVRAGGGNVR